MVRALFSAYVCLCCGDASGRIADRLLLALPLAFQNETPFAVKVPAGIGVAVLQEVVEPFLDLHPRQIFGAAGEVCEQLFATRRFDDDSAVCCGHNESTPLVADQDSTCRHRLTLSLCAGI